MHPTLNAQEEIIDVPQTGEIEEPVTVATTEPRSKKEVLAAITAAVANGILDTHTARKIRTDLGVMPSSFTKKHPSKAQRKNRRKAQQASRRANRMK